MMFANLLDRSIYFSFDRSGYLRHAKKFQPETFKGEGKVAIVTGANSGIGFAITKLLSLARAKVYMACRSKEGAEEAKQKILQENPEANLELLILNLSEPKEMINELQAIHADLLIHNAGGMPLKLTLNSEGEEIIWASQILSPYLMTEYFIEKELLKPKARIIFVSSGGMYTQKLTLQDLTWKQHSYNKYQAYANAKRALVILNELWHKQYGNKYLFSCMHPGWVNTKGVAEAMPWFYRFTRKRLRNSEEGADTILWLALTNSAYPGGKFWFDRKEAPTHLLKKTVESKEQRVLFKKILEEKKKCLLST